MPARRPELFDCLDEDAREQLRSAAMPEWLEPMLATLTKETFSAPEWTYERKLDGVRCLVFRSKDGVRLMSRNEKNMNAAWPELVDEFAEQREEEFIADGEIVAFEGNQTSFARLQKRIGLTRESDVRASNVAVYVYLFDLLHVAGHDVRRLAQRDRKILLQRALDFQDHVRFTPHRSEEGEAFLEEACSKGWEGLIAKDARASYAKGRSKKWLKFKCVGRQELVVGGYTAPRGSRQGFGALLVGHYEGNELRYAGKVGTGYSDVTLRDLSARLKDLERDDSPFTTRIREKDVHYVQPRLVAEIGFTEWTEDGKLRHPRFVGLRTDKRPKEVRREVPR